GLGPGGRRRKDSFHDSQHPQSFGFAQPVRLCVKLPNGLPNHLALGLGEAAGSLAQAANRHLIEGKCDLYCHTMAILPYPAPFGPWLTPIHHGIMNATEEIIAMADYTHPEALVSTDWVAQHSKDANVRVVEVDVDTNAYKEGHVPGSIAWSWNTQLSDTVRRDILSKHQFEKLMSESGIGNDTS